IGPVRNKVVNQLLQAAQSSPLVSQVLVRGVPRGPEGTLIAIRVTGKSALSGSVRQTGRHLYIDLEPLVSPRVAVGVGAHQTRNGPANAPPSQETLTSERLQDPASAGTTAAVSTPSARLPAKSQVAVVPDATDTLRKAEAMARALDVRGLESL